MAPAVQIERPASTVAPVLPTNQPTRAARTHSTENKAGSSAAPRPAADPWQEQQASRVAVPLGLTTSPKSTVAAPGTTTGTVVPLVIAGPSSSMPNPHLSRDNLSSAPLHPAVRASNTSMQKANPAVTGQAATHDKGRGAASNEMDGDDPSVPRVQQPARIIPNSRPSGNEPVLEREHTAANTANTSLAPGSVAAKPAARQPSLAGTSAGVTALASRNVSAGGSGAAGAAGSLAAAVNANRLNPVGSAVSTGALPAAPSARGVGTRVRGPRTATPPAPEQVRWNLQRLGCADMSRITLF